jgi:hypothetical protein
VALCRNRVNAFTCTRGTNAVTFDLVLQEGDDTVQINGQAFFRN